VPTNERDLAPIGLDDGAADGAFAHYRRAQEHTRDPDTSRARDEYVLARDLDPMPWRATTRAHDAVVAAASAPGAILCDVESFFRAASPDSSIGREWMDDHVHFSVEGQALFARALLETFVAMDGPLHVDRARLDALPDDASYSRALGRSPYTDYVAATRVRSLFEIPFMRANNEVAATRARQRADSLLTAMSDDDRRVVSEWRDPRLHGATDRPLTMMIAIDRMRRGDYASAEPLLRSARATVPEVSLWRLQLTWFLVTCRRHTIDAPTDVDRELCADAVRTGELLTRFGHDDSPEVNRFLGLAYNLAGQHDRAVSRLEGTVPDAHGADRWEVVRTLLDSYGQLGREDDARALLRRAAEDPTLSEAVRQLLEQYGPR
jgi:hypothetical protein